ncbi:MAG: hypothetical protein WC455_22725 [Dehalococcoidia bacterium]|jgi:hypothetical protein
MATYSKIALSGAANGLPVKITQTATAGDLIHTAVTGTADWDEVWLWAVNSSVAAVKLTVEFGAHTAPDSNIEVTVPAEAGLMLVVPGLLLQNALDINAFAAAANVVMLYGFVNRITA